VRKRKLNLVNNRIEPSDIVWVSGPEILERIEGYEKMSEFQVKQYVRAGNPSSKAKKSLNSSWKEMLRRCKIAYQGGLANLSAFSCYLQRKFITVMYIKKT